MTTPSRVATNFDSSKNARGKGRRNKKSSSLESTSMIWFTSDELDLIIIIPAISPWEKGYCLSLLKPKSSVTKVYFYFLQYS